MDTVQEKQFNELRRQLLILRDDCNHSKAAHTRLVLDIEYRLDIIDVHMRENGFRPEPDLEPTVPVVNDDPAWSDDEISLELVTCLIGLPNTRRDNILKLVRRQIDEIVDYMKSIQND